MTDTAHSRSTVWLASATELVAQVSWLYEWFGSPDDERDDPSFLEIKFRAASERDRRVALEAQCAEQAESIKYYCDLLCNVRRDHRAEMEGAKQEIERYKRELEDLRWKIGDLITVKHQP